MTLLYQIVIFFVRTSIINLADWWRVDGGSKEKNEGSRDLLLEFLDFSISGEWLKLETW